MSTIVVATDFSPSAANALAQAARLATLAHAKLEAVHVVDMVAALPLAGEMSAFQAQITDSLLSEARELWKGILEERPELAKVPLQIDIGSPVANICHFAKVRNASLVVVGSNGASSADRGPGIVASSCVRRSPSDVLLVHPTQTGPFKNVLVCVDFSSTSKLAIEQAIKLATIENASLHVLYVYTAPWERVKLASGAPENTDSFRASYQETLNRQIEQFVGSGRADTQWLKPTFHAIPHKHHGKAIAQFAKTLNVDVIVLGTRGSSNLHDILLGSTAEHVMRDAHRSILAVRPG